MVHLYQVTERKNAMKKQVKEIWLRFESKEEYSENEEKLLALLDTAPGDCIVKIYVSSINGYKTESGHSFDEKQLSLLTDFLGESNAKYREVEVEIPKKLKRDVPKIVQLIPCTHDLYAVYGEDGEKYKSRVLMFALCNDQQIYPLHFDVWMGVCLLDEAVFDVDRYELENGEIWEGDWGKA